MWICEQLLDWRARMWTGKRILNTAIGWLIIADVCSASFAASAGALSARKMPPLIEQFEADRASLDGAFIF